MPWCDSCDAFVAVDTLEAEGTCPTCHREVDDADVNTLAPDEADVPWHFWVVVAALAIYLGWRAVEAAGWVIERF